MAISSLNELITAAATEQLTTPARKDGTSVNSLRVNPIAETISLSAEDRRLTVDTTVQVEPSSTAVRVIDGGTPIVFVSGPTGPTGPSVISDTSIDATPIGLTTPAPAKFTRIGTDQEEFVLANSVATRILFGGECLDLQLGSNQGLGQTTINNDTKVEGTLTVGQELIVEGAVNLDGGLSIGGSLDILETLTVSSYTTLNGPVGIAKPASSSYELDVGGDVHTDGSVIIEGDLTVNGATTTIKTNDLVIKDKNIIIADGATTDAAADGAGITVKGATDKTIVWVDATDAWTLSEHLNILSGKEYRINGTGVLTSTTLGANVVNSSLTKVGTLATGTWQADIIAGTYGGTGVNNGTKTITLGGNLTTSGAFATTLTVTGATNVTLPTSGTLATLAGSESLTNKKLGSLTTNGIVTTSGGDGTLSVTATTGTGNVVLASGPTISGTSTSITNVGTFALRDTSAAFDVTVTATSNPALTAGRTLTVNMENGARSLILGGNIDVGGNLTTANTFTTSGNFALTLTTTNTTNATLPAGTVTLAANNQSMFIGTTSVAINRSSGNLALTGITSIDGYAGGLAGGNNTTLLGSIPYQSDANVTTLLAPNTTANRRFLRMTGTGTNGAAPAWDAVTATDVGLGNVTNESKATMFTSPAFTEYMTDTISGLGAGLVLSSQYYRLNSAIAGNNATGAQNIFGVRVTLAANTQYDFEMLVPMSRSAGTTSHTISLGFGGTATYNNIAYYAHSHFSTISFADVTTAGPLVPFIQTNAASVVNAATVSATYFAKYLVKGTMSIANAGTFIPQYSLSAAPGGAYTVAIGAYIRIIPLGASGANLSRGTWA